MDVNNITQAKCDAPKIIFAKSLTKKAFSNAVASGVDYGARLLVGFLITPLMVSGLGEYFFGVWKFLERLATHLSSASGRSSQALKCVVANKQELVDVAEKKQFVGCAVVVWLLFLPLLSISGALLSWYTPYFLDTPSQYHYIVRIAAIILVAVLIMVSLVEDIPRSVIEGENYGYKLLGRTTATILMGGALTWTVLSFNAGIIGVSSVLLVTTLLRGALFLRIVKRYSPWFGILRPTRSQVKKFFGLSWLFMLWDFILKGMAASDILILGMLDSAYTVTIYTLNKYAPEMLMTLITMAIFGAAPGLGGIIGSGNYEKAKQVRSEMMLATWLAVTCLGPTIVIWNHVFLRLWMDTRYYAGATPTLLIVVLVIQFVFIRNDANIIDLSLRLNHKVLLGLLSVTISLITAGILIKYFRFGISGLCIGFIAGRSILSLGYPLIVGRTLGISIFQQIKALPRPVFITAVLLFVAFKANSQMALAPLLAAVGWIEFIVFVGITICLLSMFAFFGGLSSNQRMTTLRRLRLVFFV